MEDEEEVPLFHPLYERRGLTLDLMKRLLGTINQWGEAQGRKNVKQMREITVEALLKTITAICVHKELSSMRVSAPTVNLFLGRIYREGPIEPEEPEMVVALRARKDVLFRNLERAVRAF